jgi:hypothetical protein
LNFISPVFTLPNIQQFPQLNQKIKLTKNDITIQFVLSRVTQQGYKIRFTVSLHPTKQIFSGIQIRASQIDMVSLHDAILNNIDPFDKKYVTLKEFDTMKCEFFFNFDAWFKDATNGVSPRTYLSNFNQEYKLKIQPPKMILFDIMRSMFFDYITKQFKEFIVKKNHDKKWFGSLLPKEFQKKTNVRLANMFDYQYDYMNNRFLISLKTIYILGASLLIGTGIKEIKKQNFSTRVEKNANNYSKNDWRSFIKRKFI